MLQDQLNRLTHEHNLLLRFTEGTAESGLQEAVQEIAQLKLSLSSAQVLAELCCGSKSGWCWQRDLEAMAQAKQQQAVGFDNIDTNRDGVIDRQEFDEALKEGAIQLNKPAAAKASREPATSARGNHSSSSSGSPQLSSKASPSSQRSQSPVSPRILSLTKSERVAMERQLMQAQVTGSLVTAP